METYAKRWLVLLLGLTMAMLVTLAALVTLMANQNSDTTVRGWIERSEPADHDEPQETEDAVIQGDAAAEDALVTEDKLTAEEMEEAENTADNFSTGEVARSAFTTDVVDREPVDQMSHLSLNSNRIYFFTELRNMDGQTAVHRWEHGGEIFAEVEFDVGGPRWRVWSSKDLLPQWTGTWTVSVVNTAGEVLSQASFEYGAPELESDAVSSTSR